jgi:predicted transglutaminase-like cysteine proteinase
MLMFAGCGSVASAQADGGAFMTLGSRMEAPKGFIVMCSSDATFCAKPADTDDGDSKLVTGALAAKALVARFAADRIAHLGQFRRSAKAAVSALGIPTSLAAQQELRVAKTDIAYTSPRDPFTTTTGTVKNWPGTQPNRLELGSLGFRSSAVERQPSVMADSGPDNPAIVHDVPQAEAMLRRVNEFVNARVAQKTDQQVYGRDEVWQRSGVGRRAAGDCEDIAIEKRYQLIASGFPPAQLYFAVVYERQVGLHAVLVARVGDGDYVLDSRSPYVKRWDRTSYTFVSIQSRTEPMQWHALSAESLRVAQQVDRSAPKVI